MTVHPFIEAEKRAGHSVKRACELMKVSRHNLKSLPNPERFNLTYTVQGVRKLLVRNGWSCQVPARRAMERNDDAVAGWVKEVWPCAEG
ncbi:winged helix-turn-helix domain-containing protein [Streptomyces microflavus]|uniref:helix-turn-helix domain-containing protein n=1 Tax=Streptomyces microflavus TaxID=1919 RepID=UPI003807012F